MGPGVGAQRHPQMDVRDATGLGTLSMLGSGTMGTAKECQWNELEGRNDVAPQDSGTLRTSSQPPIPPGAPEGSMASSPSGYSPSLPEPCTQSHSPSGLERAGDV